MVRSRWNHGMWNVASGVALRATSTSPRPVFPSTSSSWSRPQGAGEVASIQGLTSHQRQVGELDLRQLPEDAQDGVVHTILVLIELLRRQLAHTREKAAVGPRVEAVQLRDIVHRSQTYTFCRGGVNPALSSAGYLRVTALVTERQHAWIQGLIGSLRGL